MTHTTKGQLLRLAVAARQLGPWKAKTIRRWIKTGKIRATKAPNGHWLIPESEVIRCREIYIAHTSPH